MIKTVITGTGSYIPPYVKTNRDFAGHNFYAEDNTLLDIESHLIVEKFKQITGIQERRYAPSGIESSDMAYTAAKQLLKMPAAIRRRSTRSSWRIISGMW